MKYLISGGDGGAYGETFGPVLAEEVGEVPFLQDSRYLLLKVLDRLVVNGSQVEYILVSPRYQGDSIESMRTKECVIGVGRLLPGNPVDLKRGFKRSDVEYFAVGRSKPAAA